MRQVLFLLSPSFTVETQRHTEVEYLVQESIAQLLELEYEQGKSGSSRI